MTDFIDDHIDTNYSVPMFPGVIPKFKPERNLRLGKERSGGISIGDIFLASYELLVQFLFDFNILLFVPMLAVFPFLESAIADENATVLCSKPGSKAKTPAILSIRIKRGNETRWITPISVWDLAPEQESLDLLNRLYAYCDVGVYPTPGGLGSALMKHTWAEWELPSHTTTNGYCDKFIREHCHGGRCDTPGLGKTYPVALEFDMSSAYLAHYNVHPCGTASCFKHGFCSTFATYFARCTVEIHEKLPLGPFPLKIADTKWKSIISYPEDPGIYTDVYLWKEQVDVCRELGCTVQVHDGYGWLNLTADNLPWSKHMYILKQNADRDIEPLIKQLIVKAIGRHAMSNELYILVGENDYQEGDIPIADGDAFYAFFVHKRVDYDSTAMLHWHNYTIARTNLTLFKFALPFARMGRLIATNYDSVMVSPVAEDYTLFPSKKTNQHNRVGTWGYTELHDVTITAPRSFESIEKTVRPGVMR